MLFKYRRLGAVVRGCFGKSGRGQRRRRSTGAWWLERLEERIVPAVITVTSAADNMTVDGQVTLREAIEAANTDTRVDGSTAGSGADTIQFAAGLSGQTILLDGEELQINSSLTINGLGADLLTIDGDDSSRIFQVAFGSTVTISGLTLTNGFADEGGAIENSSANLTLNNLKITFNEAGIGGAIFGAATVNNCTITDNVATSTQGGAIRNSSGGTLNINGSTFARNRVMNGGKGGGAIYDRGNGVITIVNSTFTENSSADDGGAIHMDDGTGSNSTLTISNSGFNSNTASDRGGAIYSKSGSSASVINSQITGNTAGLEGGGIYSRVFLTVNHSSITENTAVNGAGLWKSSFGAALNRTLISGNVASAAGGGIHNEFSGGFSSTVLTDCTVDGNVAGTEGAGINNEGILTINGGTISANSSEFGGGINNLGTLTVNGTTIAANSAVFGAGINNATGLNDPIVTITNATISGNSASGNGGGINNSTTGEAITLTINNSTIVENTATGNGGGISNDNDAVSARLRSTIVANNDATGIGDELAGTFRTEYSLIERRAGATIRESVAGSNRYGVDPLLGPLADNGGATLTHALLPGSPAINRGSNPTPQSFDQRGLGYVRAAGRADIGAVEVQQKGTYLVPDLSNPAKQQLIVVGSELKDTVSVALASGRYSVTLNGRIQRFTATNVVGIVLKGNQGDDSLTLANTVLIGGILDGGTGDDTLTGSAGNDILLGGEGDDRLVGLGGRDVLIGGDGHDSLTGGIADDLLIGGATTYDNIASALLAIRSEWTSVGDYATRAANLRQGSNGAPVLNANTIADGYYDELTADTGATGGLELMFYDDLDLLTGFTPSTEQAVLIAQPVDAVPVST